MELIIRGSPSEIAAFLRGGAPDTITLSEAVRRAVKTGEAVLIRGETVGRNFPGTEGCTG